MATEAIRIRFHSGIYTLDAEQVLPISQQEAWAFFSAPENLSTITPPDMDFKITSQLSHRMHAGQIITYSIRLLPGIRRPWVTEITHVQDGCFFVDEQRFGPYAFWHHQHWFEPRGDATRILDRVTYKLPLGPLGRLLHPLIRKQLIRIFTYRSVTLAGLFPAAATGDIDQSERTENS